MCFEARQFDMLNENIIQLTKKRGQLKQVFAFIFLRQSPSTRLHYHILLCCMSVCPSLSPYMSICMSLRVLDNNVKSRGLMGLFHW